MAEKSQKQENLEEDDEECPMVVCHAGTIIGRYYTCLETYEVDHFLGIPYAKPPVGERRFKHPEPIENIGMHKAHAYGPSCVQPPVFPLTEDAKPIPQSEDCLFLNVYRKTGTKKNDNKAVMIVVHGGGFTVGGSSDLSFNASPLAAIGDVVSVSINYRLGILGFAHIKHLGPGNLGLFDQRLAFKWVKQNIRDFGGDPERVTLIGTSAGAMSICAHIMSPLNRDENLFQAVVVDAGVIAHEQVEAPETSYARVREVSRKMGCKVDISDEELMDFLREANVRDLVANSFDIENRSPMLTFIPTADDIFILKDVGANIRKKADNFLKIRAMIGYAKDEGTLFANYYLDRRPFPNIRTEEHFLYWCSRLAKAYNHQVDTETNVELRKKIIDSYYKKHSDPFKAAAAFIGDGTFKCPTNAFVQSWSRFNKEIYVYQFERQIAGEYFKMDPKVLGVYHFSPFLHFTGAVLDWRYPPHPEDVKRFPDYIALVTNFAKSAEPPSFKGLRWPNYAKGEGIMILDDKPSIRPDLPSLETESSIFSFHEEKNWMDVDSSSSGSK